MNTGHTHMATQPSKLILKCPQNPTPENTHSKQIPNQNTNTFGLWPYPIKIPPLKSKSKPKPKSPNTLTKKRELWIEKLRKRKQRWRGEEHHLWSWWLAVELWSFGLEREKDPSEFSVRSWEERASANRRRSWGFSHEAPTKKLRLILREEKMWD